MTPFGNLLFQIATDMNEAHQQQPAPHPVDDAPPPCPECGATGEDSIWRGHHHGDWGAPECGYWHCVECEHQWGHE